LEKRVVLTGGQQLTPLMIDHEVGVTPVAKYSVERIENTSKWIGKEVYLKTEQFKIQGKDVTGIIGEPVK
jgi:hypothetical protein